MITYEVTKNGNVIGFINQEVANDAANDASGFDYHELHMLRQAVRTLESGEFASVTTRNGMRVTRTRDVSGHIDNPMFEKASQTT